MNENPARYIRSAFSKASISLHKLIITDYTPESFGNLVAHAETDLGSLRIVYDRSFYIDVVDAGERTQPTDEQIRTLVTALEEAKRAT